jgi:hypothetical protein
VTAPIYPKGLTIERERRLSNVSKKAEGLSSAAPLHCFVQERGILDGALSQVVYAIAVSKEEILGSLPSRLGV